MDGDLRPLRPETWGEKLRRAKWESGLTYDELADRVRAIRPTARGTLFRLELLAAVPRSPKLREVAAIYALALGYTLASFDLSEEDLPAGVSVESVLECWRRGITRKMTQSTST
jgi:transcriptional regulator with XRE-family HTH domain